MDWAALLSRVPKLVAECTTCSSPATKRNANKVPGDFADLLALLQQMAGRENQEQVRQFYAGKEAFLSSTGTYSAVFCEVSTADSFSTVLLL